MASFLNRILCIDDDEHLLAATRIALEATKKYDIAQFTRVSEALSFLKTHTPDLILLDVMMPEMDGIEAFRHIRDIPALQAVPIIFMTAMISPQEIGNYQTLGGTAVITKPFDPLDLPYQLEFILGRLQAAS